MGWGGGGGRGGEELQSQKEFTRTLVDSDKKREGVGRALYKIIIQQNCRNRTAERRDLVRRSTRESLCERERERERGERVIRRDRRTKRERERGREERERHKER